MVKLIITDGEQVWSRIADGVLHREDGPALIRADGTHSWYRNGLRHREDGPAVILAGVQLWYMHDELHREDGPALEFDCGDVGWYLHNKGYSFNDYINLITISEQDKMLLILKYNR